MARRTRPGLTPYTMYIEDALHAEWKAFAQKENVTLREAIIDAMARHIAYPPPRKVEVVAPPAPFPKRKPGRPKKEKQE